MRNTRLTRPTQLELKILDKADLHPNGSVVGFTSVQVTDRMVQRGWIIEVNPQYRADTDQLDRTYQITPAGRKLAQAARGIVAKPPAPAPALDHLPLSLESERRLDAGMADALAGSMHRIHPNEFDDE